MEPEKVTKKFCNHVNSYYTMKESVKSFIQNYTRNERFYRVRDIIDSLQSLTGSFFCGIYNYIPQKANYYLKSLSSRRHEGNDNYLFHLRYIRQKSEIQDSCCFGKKQIYISDDTSFTIPFTNDTNLTIKDLQNCPESYVTFPKQVYDMLDSANISYTTFEEIYPTLQEYDRLKFFKHHSVLKN